MLCKSKIDLINFILSTPDEYFGNVMGDLTSRRGRPLGQESQGNAVKLSAMVPLADCLLYTSSS